MIKYDVNEATGVVTATISGCENDVINRVNKAMRSRGYSQVNADTATYLVIPGTFTGKAKCHPEDKFNEETGKEIAKKRLLDKYHEARIKAFGRSDKSSEFYQMVADKEIQKSISYFHK